MISPPADNIFVRILRGELPCHKLYEDEHSFAFLDIYPLSRGHSLVLPKHYCRNLLDSTADGADGVLATLRLLSRTLCSVVGSEGCTVLSNAGLAAGQTVDYLHWHIIPRHAGDGLSLTEPGAAANHSELAQLADRVRAALGQEQEAEAQP